jgi:hypothetical protein
MMTLFFIIIYKNLNATSRLSRFIRHQVDGCLLLADFISFFFCLFAFGEAELVILSEMECGMLEQYIFEKKFRFYFFHITTPMRAVRARPRNICFERIVQFENLNNYDCN